MVDDKDLDNLDAQGWKDLFKGPNKEGKSLADYSLDNAEKGFQDSLEDYNAYQYSPDPEHFDQHYDEETAFWAIAFDEKGLASFQRVNEVYTKQQAEELGLDEDPDYTYVGTTSEQHLLGRPEGNRIHIHLDVMDEKDAKELFGEYLLSNPQYDAKRKQVFENDIHNQLDKVAEYKQAINKPNSPDNKM